MNNDDTKPQVAVHRAQIGMPPEMFRGLKIMAAEQGTSVTALVMGLFRFGGVGGVVGALG